MSAKVEVRGYVNKPQAKTTAGEKAYSSFFLNVKQKGYKDKPATYASYSVTDWKNASPPPEGSYVTISGWLEVRQFEKGGVKRQSLDINATELTVAPPREDLAPPSVKSTTQGSDEFDFEA